MISLLTLSHCGRAKIGLDSTLPWRGRVGLREAKRNASRGGVNRKMVSTSIRRNAARKLRANTTPHERLLWRALKELPQSGTHFRRQAPLGRYVVDFLCPAKRLVIEIDGGHHNDDETAKHDRERQQWLEKEGYRVLRFWNSEIARDLKAVLAKIYVELHGALEAEIAHSKHRRRRRLSPHPAASRRPSPSRGG